MEKLTKTFNGLIWKMVTFFTILPSIEHFIVWMRTAGLPNFRKLWGRIEETIPAGNYRLTINNNYDVTSFDGKKTFVMSTTNKLGGKNYFLAICYIVVGAMCLIFAIIFLIAYMRKKSQRRRRD